MWKPNQPGATPSTPDPTRPTPPATGSNPDTRTPATTTGTPGAAGALSTGEQATIGKSLVIKGEVSGSESLYIDGKVEGAINLPGNRVTVGRNGQVAANVVAREIVVPAQAPSLRRLPTPHPARFARAATKRFLLHDQAPAPRRGFAV